MLHQSRSDQDIVNVPRGSIRPSHAVTWVRRRVFCGSTRLSESDGMMSPRLLLACGDAARPRRDPTACFQPEAHGPSSLAAWVHGGSRLDDVLPDSSGVWVQTVIASSALTLRIGKLGLADCPVWHTTTVQGKPAGDSGLTSEGQQMCELSWSPLNHHLLSFE